MECVQQIADNLCQHGFYVIDNFLDAPCYVNLQQKIQNMDTSQFTPAKIGPTVAAKHHADLRNDQIYWLTKNTKDGTLHTYFKAIDHIIQHLNETLFLGLTHFEMHFSIYRPGNFYKKHSDQFSNNNDRRISCVYYLNENWYSEDGGELTLYDKHNQILGSILPQGNRFICFNSEILHEVQTTHRTRLSIAGWLKVRPTNHLCDDL